MELFIKILLFIGFISEFFLGTLCLLKEKEKIINKYFCLMMFSGASWNLFLLLGIIFADNIFDRLAIIFSLFACTFFLLFAKAFSKQEKTANLFSLLAILFPFLLAPIILFSDIIIGKTLFHPKGFIDLLYGPAAILFYIFHFLYSFIISYYFIKGYKSAVGVKKMQFQYLLTGLGLVLFYFFVTNFILPFFGAYQFIYLSALCFIVLAICFLYIITRYRFMDIRIVIKKAVVHLISFSLLILIIASLILSANKYLLQNYNLTNVAIIEVIIIVTFLPILKKFLLNIINKYIQKDEIDLSRNIEEFNNDISYSNYLDDLIEKCVSFICKELSIQKVDFIVRDFTKPELGYFFPQNNKKLLDEKLQNILVGYFSHNKEILLKQEIPFLKANKENNKNLQEINHFLNKGDYEAIISLKQGDIINGFLLLGSKADKEIYSQEEAKLLQSLGEQVNVALYRVLSYEEAVWRVKREFGQKNN